VPAVSDCAPTRGAARHLRHPPQPPPELAKLELDSGFVSSLGSPSSPAPLKQKLRYPKEHRSAPAGGAIEDERLSREFAGLNVQREEPLSPEEARTWESRYVAALEEAFRGDEDGDTHLHLAIIYGFCRVSECLVRLAPHPNFLNLRNSYLQTPLHLAALTGQAELCRHLVVAGADTSRRDRHGNTALHIACGSADHACVHALTADVLAEESRRYGSSASAESPPPPPPLNDWNYQGLSCLHLAVMAGDQILVAHLVAHGADVSAAEGKSGRTSLHLAAEAGNAEMLQLLALACCADVNAVTYGGASSYQLALRNAQRDVAELLATLGAKCQEMAESEDSEMSDSDSEMQLLKTEDLFADVRLGGRPLLAAP